MSTIDKIRAEMQKRATATGTDAKFFTTNRKGENHELREELRNPQRDRKRDAVKKVSITANDKENLKLYKILIFSFVLNVGHCEHDGGKRRFYFVSRCY